VNRGLTVLHILNVFLYLQLNTTQSAQAVLYCHLWPVQLYHTFPHISHKRQDFRSIVAVCHSTHSSVWQWAISGWTIYLFVNGGRENYAVVGTFLAVTLLTPQGTSGFRVTHFAKRISKEGLKWLWFLSSVQVHRKAVCYSGALFNHCDVTNKLSFKILNCPKRNLFWHTVQSRSRNEKTGEGILITMKVNSTQMVIV